MPYSRGGLWFEKEGDVPRLVLLHGNGEDLGIFSPLREELKDEMGLLLADSPGQGKSAPESSFSYRPMAEKIASLLDEELPEPAVILGFSDGGILALELAFLIPEKIRGLMLLGVNVFPEGLDPSYLASARREYAESGSPLLGMMLREPHFTAEDLRKIKLPCLVAAGEHDLILPEHSRYIADTLPRAELLILPGEDHSSYINGSRAFVPFVRRFMARLDEAAGEEKDPPQDASING